MHPSWSYHRTQAPRLVRTQAELDALAPNEWLDSPHVFLNTAADCCDAAASSRGYRHTEECTFGAPAPVVATPDQSQRTGQALSPDKLTSPTTPVVRKKR